MKRYLPFIIVAVVAVTALGAGFALYRSKQVPAPTAAKDANPTGEHIRGKSSAPVTIEEFGDFQCPPCSVMAGVLKKIEADNDSKVRLVFHHFPLAMHVNARPAAHAAEAAHLQGHFWEMHDLLYKEQANWSKAPEVEALLVSYATTLGLDVERFKKDMDGPVAKERVEADHQLGSSRGVTSTPTIFINNVLLPATSIGPDGLRKAIAAAAEGKPIDPGKDKPKP